MTDYKPISCIDYSHLEVAILHRNPLHIAWRDATGLDHIETLHPFDLQTRKGEEFLKCRSSSGADLEIRLDKILRFNASEHG